MNDRNRSKYLVDTEAVYAAEAEEIIRRLDRELEKVSNVRLVTKREEEITAVLRFPVKEDAVLALRLFAKLLDEYFLLFDYLDEISFSVFAASFFRNYDTYLLLVRTVAPAEKDPEKIEKRFYELSGEFALKPHDPAVLLKLLATGKARNEMRRKKAKPVSGETIALCWKKEILPEWFPADERNYRPLLQMLRDNAFTENCRGMHVEEQKQSLLAQKALLEERIALLGPQCSSADRSREYDIAVKQYERILKNLAELRIL